MCGREVREDGVLGKHQGHRSNVIYPGGLLRQCTNAACGDANLPLRVRLYVNPLPPVRETRNGAIPRSSSRVYTLWGSETDSVD